MFELFGLDGVEIPHFLDGGLQDDHILNIFTIVDDISLINEGKGVDDVDGFLGK